MIVTIDGGSPIISVGYTPANYSDQELMKFAGTFYSEELSTNYIFAVKDGKLIARHSRLSDIEFKPVKDDLFSGNRWFFSKVEFVRNDNDQISGLRVSSGRVRNLWFEKLP